MPPASIWGRVDVVQTVSFSFMAVTSLFLFCGSIIQKQHGQKPDFPGKTFFQKSVLSDCHLWYNGKNARREREKCQNLPIRN